MRLSASKEQINYRRGNGNDGYCKDCGNMVEQLRLFGPTYLNCIIIGVGTKKKDVVTHDFTCDLFWEK
jgi:RNA polymerase-binding transcription factor DksA